MASGWREITASKSLAASSYEPLNICDMACGSGAFLVQACRYMSERLLEAWEAIERQHPCLVRITPEGELSQGLPEERLIPKDPDERLTYAMRLVARLEGKSSLGRLGLLIHSTAGYVDPGWKGNLTLELSNVASLPIALYQGMRIGQISFFRMSSPVERPYGSAGLGSKYQGQSEPTASAFHRDFAAGRRLDPAPTD